MSGKNTAYEIVHEFDEIDSFTNCVWKQVRKTEAERLLGLDNILIHFEKAVNELKTTGAMISGKENLT